MQPSETSFQYFKSRNRIPVREEKWVSNFITRCEAGDYRKQGHEISHYETFLLDRRVDSGFSGCKHQLKELSEIDVPCTWVAASMYDKIHGQKGKHILKGNYEIRDRNTLLPLKELINVLKEEIKLIETLKRIGFNYVKYTSTISNV